MSSENSLKVIDKIEVKIKPKSFDNNKDKSAQVGYVHTVLDKLITDLNDTFVPKLDNVLNNDKNSIDTLSNDLTNEKGKLNVLVTSVGDSSKGLIKDLNDLKGEIEKLKIGTTGGDDIDEWEAPTHHDIL